MGLSFLLTQRGKKLLTEGGYMYTQKNKTLSAFRWRCINWTKARGECPAAVNTDKITKSGNI